MSANLNSLKNANTIDSINLLVAADMRILDQAIRTHLSSDVALINQISEYIIGSGGKRLRPMLLILAARACGYSGDQHTLLAAIIEFIHTATLLHDDVVDESERRRGKLTAHAVFGNAASVLVGDFLYSRSFQMMIEIDSMRVMQILSSTTNTIAEGEVQQLLNIGDPQVDEATYMEVISNKTAKLFESACQLGAVISHQDKATEMALVQFGGQLGLAFQIVDDCLDYEADSDTLGKNLGDDLAEGKPTLPLIYARARADQAQQNFLDSVIREGNIDELPRVLEIIHETNALDLAHRRAEEISLAAAACLNALPDTVYRQAMHDICSYAINRNR
ncbi:MAG: polyprenyl synthetase family protein [Xanthomonadales bacterium]|nr:polyprenyl synthetase family protein [Xanthomonadales bacterium]